jgi:hypothetical protein
MCSCAPVYFRVNLFTIVLVTSFDLVKNCHFQLVSHVAQIVFNLESWNFTRMLISTCNCAPWYFRVDIFSIFRVIALGLVKNYNFQLESHVTKKVFDLESWNFIEMLISMWMCAPGDSLVDLFCFVRVIALDLVKKFNFQLMSHVAQKVFDIG